MLDFENNSPHTLGTSVSPFKAQSLQMNVWSKKQCADTTENMGTLDFVGQLLSHAEGLKFSPGKWKPGFMVRVLGEDQVVCYYLTAVAFKESKSWVRPAVLVTLNLPLDRGHQQASGEGCRGKTGIEWCLPPWGTCAALSLTLASQGENHKHKNLAKNTKK